jgi:hypothetical protein
LQTSGEFPGCQSSFRHGLQKSGDGEEQFNRKQSAEQLDVQKNILRIGFDSSTENMAIFRVPDQKKEVAPFPVKN